MSEELRKKPRYGLISVSDDLTLNFDSVNSMWKDECNCVMVGLSEIDSLIEKLQEVKPLLQKSWTEPPSVESEEEL
jgi:hypothetical protein